MGFVRSFLALLVVFGHIAALDRSAPAALGGGTVIAVYLFFVISGFYMALVLDQKYRSDTFAFYRARALRLYPLYFVTLAVTLVLAYVVLPQSFLAGVNRNIGQLVSGNSQWFAPLVLFSNLTFFGLDLGNIFCLRFQAGTVEFFTHGLQRCYPFIGFSPVPQAWTLGAEVLFYLVIPFIFRFGWRSILAALLIGVAAKTTLYLTGLHQAPWDRMPFIVVLTYFMLGVVAYRVYAKLTLPDLNRYWPIMVAAITACLTAYTLLTPTLLTPWPLFVEPLTVLAFALILPFLFHASKNARLDSIVGEFSYPIYITHIMALAISTSLLKTGFIADSILRISVHLAIVLAIAGLGVWGVTLPMERIRRSYGIKPKAAEISDPVPKPATV